MRRNKMPTFTPAQQHAIDDHGKDILVSASAGSGKTTVLVERVLNEILKGTPVDNLLIITFTKAAANEMKERIKTELSARLKKNQDNKFLRDQLLNVDTANISTIDSFCLDIIRRFYYVIELDPSFSVLTDETQAALLRERALNEIEKEYLERQDQDFIDFYDNFAGDREVDSAHNLLLDLYNSAMTQPNYENFLMNLADYYKVDKDLISSNLWQEKIKPYLLSQLISIRDQVEKLLSLSQYDQKELAKQKESFSLFESNLNNLIKAIEQNDPYDDQVALFKLCKFEGSPRISKKWDEDLRAVFEEGKTFKNTATKQLHELFAQFYITNEDEQVKILDQSKRLVTIIGKVELDLINRFNRLKREQNLLDYSDMEQLAYQILTTNSSKSQLAQEYYQNKFSEILIDEYQDVNELQEEIVQAIKKKGKNNLFMVGDVKQSIYGFRQARPQLFLDKYESYAATKDDETERIILADNFRSTKNVTTTVNRLFNPVLTKDFGGINYQAEGELVFGAKYYPDDLDTTSEFIYGDKEDNQVKVAAASNDKEDFAEIQMVIQRIKQLKENNFQVYDPKTKLKRNLEYSDIAILTRTRSDNLEIMQEFAKENIPLFISDAQNYFQTFELIIIMNLLRIIDNPRQDIPLVAVLRSPIFNFTEPELAQLRIKTKKGDFFDAVANYASENSELGEKSRNFLNQLEEFRKFSTTNRISELIWTIYEKTHLLEIVTGLPNGQQRRLNLQSLYERATSYETAGFKGLYQFITFIERMRRNQKDLAQPLLSNEIDNAVKLMTIHGSKGLEFPVVFVVGLNHQYQKRDLSNSYDINGDIGLGLTIKTPDYKIDSLVKSVIDTAKKKENLEEEARILYVGLTRARQKLILVAALKKKKSEDDFFAKWEQALDRFHKIPFNQKVAATSPLSFLGPELAVERTIDHQISERVPISSENKNIYFIKYEATKQNNKHEVEKRKSGQDNPKLISVAEKLYNFKYPFIDATHTTAYQAVSEIKRAFSDPDENELENARFVPSTNRYLQPIDATPSFLKKSNFTGAEIGTATHLLLQYYDYQGKKKRENLDEEIDKLIDLKKLNPDIVNFISKDAIEWFVNSEFAKPFWTKPQNLKREEEFSSLIEAKQIFDNFSDPSAKILVHGTIDGYYIEDDGVVLFDYKTDHIDKSHLEEEIENIKKKYQGQLKLYEAALNGFSKKKVKAKYLVLLDIQKLVKLD